MTKNLTDLERLTAKLIAFKFGYTEMVAESLAVDFCRDDFPKNGIQTAGQAIAYLDDLADRVKEQRAARGAGR
jgi:hypothetical protein